MTMRCMKGLRLGRGPSIGDFAAPLVGKLLGQAAVAVNGKLIGILALERLHSVPNLAQCLGFTFLVSVCAVPQTVDERFAGGGTFFIFPPFPLISAHFA